MREREIIERIVNRDESGMDALLCRYGPLIRYVVAPILPNEQDREECVSEIALRIWDRIELFREQKGSWTAWLTAISRNTALNRARSLTGQSEPLSEDMPDQKPSPEEELLRKERQEQLLRALDGLTAEERALFYRKYYYLQSTGQIAAELGMTVRAVEGRLYRLRKRLRDALGGDGNG